MSWQGQLTLRYQRDGERTIAHDRHHGPLRVLQRLYPEGRLDIAGDRNAAVSLERQDLDELLGTQIENAAK